MPLSLVIGVAANDPTSVAVANTAADQLRNVGIAASVLGAGSRGALRRRADATTGSTRSSAGIRPAATSRRRWRRGTAARRWRPRRCRRPPPARPRRRRRRRPAPGSAAADAAPRRRHRPRRARRRNPDELVQAPSNITGICDRSIQPKIDAALDGTENIGEVINAVEPRLWNMSTVLPILQDTTIVAAGPERAERQPVGRGAGRHRRRRRQVGQGTAVDPTWGSAPCRAERGRLPWRLCDSVISFRRRRCWRRYRRSFRTSRRDRVRSAPWWSSRQHL